MEVEFLLQTCLRPSSHLFLDLIMYTELSSDFVVIDHAWKMYFLKASRYTEPQVHLSSGSTCENI